MPKEFRSQGRVAFKSRVPSAAFPPDFVPDSDISESYDECHNREQQRGQPFPVLVVIEQSLVKLLPPRWTVGSRRQAVGPALGLRVVNAIRRRQAPGRRSFATAPSDRAHLNGVFGGIVPATRCEKNHHFSRSELPRTLQETDEKKSKLL